MARRPQRILAPLMALLVAGLLGPAARADLPPGEPTFFAGNPVTRQLAFRYRVGLRVLGCTDDRTGVYGLYGQSSFWLLDNEDRGYTVESNYEPEVQLFVAGARLGGWWPRQLDLGLSYSHHSNGIDGGLSRSWNHVNGGLYLGDPTRRTLSGSLVAWLPFNEEIGNRDIASYAGHGRLAVDWRPRRDVPLLGRTDLYAGATFSFDRGPFTGVETSLSFAPRWLGRPPFPGPEPGFAFFVQWFLGRGESLIEYAAYRSTLRFGLRLW